MSKRNESRDEYILRRMKEESSLEKQVGGNHYKDCAIQPIEYIEKNNLTFCEGNIVKYVTRHRTKGEGKKRYRKSNTLRRNDFRFILQ